MTDNSTLLAEQLLREAREELHRADGKAATLFAVFGLALGAVLAGTIAGDWSPRDLACGAEFLWWIGSACVLGALVALAAAIWPRLDSDHATGHVTYFAHVTRYASSDDLRDAIALQASNPIDRPTEQLLAISEIVMKKYRLVQLATMLYGIGLAGCCTAVLIG